MTVTSIAEIVSIGAVFPFLAALTAPETLFANERIQPLISVLGLTQPKQLLLPLTILFIGAACAAGAMRMLLLLATTRVSFATGADMSIGIYRRTLYQPYTIHCARNSSEVISGISSKSSAVIYNTIIPLLTLSSSCLMLSFILFALLVIDTAAALSAFLGFGIIYFFIIRLTRRRLLENSQQIARESTNVVKSLQEGLGGIRDVLIGGCQDSYCDIYRDAYLPLRRAECNNLFISTCPRYAMEAIGMSLIAALAYLLAEQSDGLARAIPVVGALALGAQRLLPVLQQAYSAWSAIRGGQASLQDTLDLLDQPLTVSADQLVCRPLSFDHSLEFKQLSFRYSFESPFFLNRISFTVGKGDRVGIIGATGCGKSTLLDVVMGLLHPTAGTFEVDGVPITNRNNREWQARVAHVPQSIFLADRTIEENIAFGVTKHLIDPHRVRRAAQKAQIAEQIESWPLQYNTMVGERGIRLSGGQCQRIGIARAFYRDADVIVFDEATSALDSNTESAVMESISTLSNDFTLFVVAHRLTTLQNCTKIIELDKGEIIRVCAYQDIAF